VVAPHPKGNLIKLAKLMAGIKIVKIGYIE
jgi:hypothetical protein